MAGIAGSTPWRRPASRRFVIGVLAIAAVALALRVLYVRWIAPDELGLDATWYLLVGGGLVDEGYIDPAAFHGAGIRQPTANFPPGWPGVLALVSWLGADRQASLQLIGPVLGAVTVVLAALLGRRVASPTVGVAAAVVVAASPLVIASDGSLMSESLFTAMVAATTLLAYATIDHPTLARAVALGTMAGLATLVRSEGVLLLGLLIAATLVRAELPARRLLAFALASTVALGAVMTPWTIRNARAFEDPVLLSTNSGGLLEGANCPSTYSGEMLGAWDFECITAAADPTLEPSTGARISSERAVDHALANTARLPIVAAARVLRLWGVWDPLAQAELEAVESRVEGWQVAGWVYGMATNVAAAAGLLVLIRRRATVAPMVALLAGVTTSALISWGNQRFRLSAEPVLAVLAAVTLVALGRRVAPTRRRVRIPS